MTFRVVRFPISDSEYETVITNLPRNVFPLEKIKALYFERRSVETSFRKLKYIIGLINFHAHKPDFIKQEIWAKLIAYNLTETMINHTPVEEENRKYPYKVNFSVAAHICKEFIRGKVSDVKDILFLLQRELIPIRDGRCFDHLQTAHFRKPRHFIYRAS